MNSEKWQRAKELYQAAIELGQDERARFLDESSGGDEEIRLEVESLLACAEENSDFLEKPVIGEVAEAIVSQRSLTGRKILQYNVIELLGSGGMGEVYLAEDTRLRRKIALKILPPSLGENTKFVHRFEREACAASALNHPNILTVHEIGENDGVNFIASEFVKGQTLRARLLSGKPVDLPETLDIVLQVAAALRAAHESNIVHRDIKPENIMIREDGIVKVLDFGLAKLAEDKSEPVNSKVATWLTTMPGMIMGTAVYMSPEQARGRETNARTDIWSLGIVLYEMLAGKPPFEGDTASDTMASILVREPPRLENLPRELAAVLEKALQKDEDKRYRSINELIVDLESFRQGPDFEAALIDRKRIRFAGGDTLANRPASDTIFVTRRRLQSANRKLIVSYVLLSILTVVAFIWIFYPSKQGPAPLGISNSVRPIPLMKWNAEAGEDDVGAKFSPNGTRIAYVRMENERSSIWTRQIPDGNPIQAIKDKWDYYNPVWSPDGEKLAFISNRNDQLAIWTTPFSGGSLTFVALLEGTNTLLLKWSRSNEKIYLQQGDSKTGLNVFALDLVSKQITQITKFDPASQAQFFNVSHDEGRIAYSAQKDGRLHIFVVPVAGGKPSQVTNDSEANDEYPFWLPDGKRIVYSSQRDDIFQPSIAYVDEGRTAPLNLDTSDTLVGDVSADGSKILFQRSQEDSNIWKVGVDGKNETQITTDVGLELWPDVSPDSKNIVFQATTESKHLLKSAIIVRSIEDSEPVTIASNGYSPSFSPDGQKVAFLRDTGQIPDLWITGRNGAGERQLTSEGVWFPPYTEVPYNRTQVRDFRWSQDGTSLVFCGKKNGVWNFWQAAVDGTGEPRQISGNHDENIRLYSAAISPDGKRIAWTSLPDKPNSNGRRTMHLYLWDGESTREIYESEPVIRLIGWVKNSLVIALPGERSTSKPLRVSLKLITPDGKPERNIASIDGVYFNNIQLSADGSRIALATREAERDNIRIISIPGGQNTRIVANTDPTIYLSGIAWSPDNRSVYFSKQKVVGTIWMFENFK